MYTDKAFTGGPALAEEVPAFWALSGNLQDCQRMASRGLLAPQFCR